MSDSISISVLGTAQVEAALDALLHRKHDEVQAAIERATTNTYDGSQADCPVDTGALKASGAKEIGELEGTVSYGDDKVDYAPFVELGTSRQHAQPYLFPNFAKNGRVLKSDCEEIAKG